MSGRGRGGGGRGAYYKARYGNGGKGGRGGSNHAHNDSLPDQASSSHQNGGQTHDWAHLYDTLVNIDGAQYGKLLLFFFRTSYDFPF